MTANNSGAIQTQKSSDLGDITLTATWSGADLSNVVLTDDNGKTYAFNTAHQLVEAGLNGGVRGVAVTVTLSFTPGAGQSNATLAAYVGHYTATISHGTTDNRLKIIDRDTVGDAGTDLFKDDSDNAISFDFEIKYDGTSQYIFVLDGTSNAASKTFVVAVDGGASNQAWADRDATDKNTASEANAALGGTLSIVITPKN